MKAVRSTIFTGIGLVWACSMLANPNSKNNSRDPRYHFEIADRPKEQRFVLTLKSLDDRPICIYVEKWPNRNGQVHFGSTWVKLESTERTYAARDENFGYCMDANGKPCVLEIPPHGTLEGFIGYDQFGDPMVIAKLAHRKLRFPVSAKTCKK